MGFLLWRASRHRCYTVVGVKHEHQRADAVLSEPVEDSGTDHLTSDGFNSCSAGGGALFSKVQERVKPMRKAGTCRLDPCSGVCVWLVFVALCNEQHVLAALPSHGSSRHLLTQSCSKHFQLTVTF